MTGVLCTVCGAQVYFIFTGKADTKDFTVLVFTGNAHFQ